MPTLTPRQQRFVQEYALDNNASQAARRAGLHPDSGRRLLHDPKVQASLARCRAKFDARVSAKRDRLIAHLEAVIYANIIPFLQWAASNAGYEALDDLPEDIKAALDASVSISAKGKRIRINTKKRDAYIRLLAQLLGMTTTKYNPIVLTPEQYSSLAEEKALSQTPIQNSTFTTQNSDAQPPTQNLELSTQNSTKPYISRQTACAAPTHPPTKPLNSHTHTLPYSDTTSSQSSAACPANSNRLSTRTENQRRKQITPQYRTFRDIPEST